MLDLQAKFGNKWARIATYLPGRTDNDVKNFWSTRQKRLARISRSSLPPRSSKNDKELPAVSSYEAPPNMEVSQRYITSLISRRKPWRCLTSPLL